MLYLNISRLLKAKGITRPYTYFREHGFTHYQATALTAGKPKSISFRVLEKLCFMLDCTPNDLLDWKQDDEKAPPKVSALQQLGNKPPLPDFTGINRLLRKFSYEDLQELAAIMKSRWNKGDSSGK